MYTFQFHAFYIAAERYEVIRGCARFDYNEGRQKVDTCAKTPLKSGNYSRWVQLVIYK